MKALSRRERDVLAVMDSRRIIRGIAQLVRALNLDAPCEWCPVMPPKPGEKAAFVPIRSREIATQIIQGLVAKKLMDRHHPGTPLASWTVPGFFQSALSGAGAGT